MISVLVTSCKVCARPLEDCPACRESGSDEDEARCENIGRLRAILRADEADRVGRLLAEALALAGAATPIAAAALDAARKLGWIK